MSSINGKLTDLVDTFNEARRELEQSHAARESCVKQLERVVQLRAKLLDEIRLWEDRVQQHQRNIRDRATTLRQAEAEIRAFCSQVGTAERLMGGNREAE